jgi:hypothetical protein
MQIYHGISSKCCKDSEVLEVPPLVRNSEAVFLITPSRLWRREPAAQRAELGVEAVAPLLPFWRSPQVVRSCGPSVDSVGIGDSWKFGSLR